MANSVDPDQTALIGAVCSWSTLFVSIINSSVILGNFLQQTLSADIFRCIFFLDALRVKPVSIQLYPCKPNEISKCYQLDQSISALRVVGWYFTFCQISIEHNVSNSGDPDQTPHSVAIDLGLRCLPLCHTKRTLCLYGLNCLPKLYSENQLKDI